MRQTRNMRGSCAVAALSIVLGAGVALAQGPEQKQQGPQQTPQAAPPAQAPPARKAQQNRSETPAARPSGQSENRGAENRGAKPQAQGSETKRQPDAKARRATEGPQQPKAERTARDRNDGARAGRQQSEDGNRNERKQNKAAERASDGDAKQNRARKAQEKASQRDDQQKRKQGDARDRSDRPGGKAAEGKAAEGKAAEGKAGQGKAAEGKPAADRAGDDRGLRTRLSDEQRRDVRQRFSAIRDRPVVSRVNFNIRVGTRVPRTVRLVIVPASILAVAPIYRDYRYFVADDRIVIVEPTTYEIVDVIESSGPARGGMSAGLELTPREREIVRAKLPDDIYRAQFRFDLALGADVPANVVLREFPRDIVRDVPKLEGYRFVLVGDDIVIVERDSRDVALVVR